MSKRFTDWREARDAAQALADQCRRPAAVRRAVEFGRGVYRQLGLTLDHLIAGRQRTAEGGAQCAS